MKRFLIFRRDPPKKYVENGYANPSSEPQCEGVVFDDGTVAVRWLTQYKSHSIWPNWQTFYNVHGHPEYGTIIKWIDVK